MHYRSKARDTFIYANAIYKQEVRKAFHGAEKRCNLITGAVAPPQKPEQAGCHPILVINSLERTDRLGCLWTELTFCLSNVVEQQKRVS